MEAPPPHFGRLFELKNADRLIGRGPWRGVRLTKESNLGELHSISGSWHIKPPNCRP
jgi:hypothetical protein